jgi:hypothetical protein
LLIALYQPSNDDPFGIGGIGTVNKGAVTKKGRESMYSSGKATSN